MRIPIAFDTAFAIAPMGGTMGVSPTTAHPVGMTRIRFLDDDRIDHRHVGADGDAVVEEPRVFELAIRSL